MALIDPEAWDVQFFRYGIVGLASNALLYISYLLLTAMGLEHKLAMTLLYVFGVFQTFVFNRRWTFNHTGAAHWALIRYISAYVFGYVLNLLVLMILVDRWGLPHQWVQGGAILLIALLLFLLQKYWVFPREGVGNAKVARKQEAA